MQLFEELKRRNVFRVSIGYLVSAWLISQAADFGLDLIGAPEWVLRAIVLIMALAFPVVVFFSWAYEVTPEGIKREQEVVRDDSITHVTGKKLDKAIMGLLVLALGYFIWESRFAPGSDPVPQATPQVTQEADQSFEPVEETRLVEDRSIAVLPFDNRSNLDEDQFFTDGIHDDLLTTLAKIGSMKVISRTSVLEYRDTTKKIPEIAEELGVAHVLEGGIQRAGNQVRINVQLIDAQADEHVWAEIFDRELTAENLFAIQSEISNKIAEALQTALTPDEQDRLNAVPTNNLAAYEAYMRGKQLMAMRRTDDLEAATKEFETAVALDSDFALAWVGVADSYNLWTNYANNPVEETLAKREEAVQNALALDPNLGEAWVSQATIHDDLEQPEESEAAFRKAIELSPNYATAYHWYANDLNQNLLRSREALVLSYKAAELDPRSLIIKANLVSALIQHGRYSEGEQRARELIELQPEFTNPYGMLINAYMWNMGEYAQAVLYSKKFEQVDPDNNEPLRLQLQVLAQVGDIENARKIQEEIADRWPDHVYANWLDFVVALEARNIPVLRESLPWLNSKRENTPWLINLMAYTTFMVDDLEQAKELYLEIEPRWREPDAWELTLRNQPGQGCFIAWLMLNTGESELGSQLLTVASDFIENRLPAAVEHPDAYSPDFCYMAAGDYERAITSLEMQIAHGHLFAKGSQLSSALYDPIRQEPRFLAVLQERERKTQVQRDLIDEMRRNGEI